MFFFRVALYILFEQPKKRVLVSLILFLRAFHHLETLYILSLVFIQTGNRKSELCKASMLCCLNITNDLKTLYEKFNIVSKSLDNAILIIIIIIIIIINK